MKQGSSRKIAVILLSVMSVAILAVSIAIGWRLQQNQAARNTDASGFGSTANRGLYDIVTSYFTGLRCEDFFTKEYLIEFANDNKLSFVDPDFVAINRVEPRELESATCIFNISEGFSFTTKLKHYKRNSPIDNSEAALFKRVQEETLIPDRILDSGKIGKTTYFFGVNKDFNCSTLFFHEDNEFESGRIDYYNIPCQYSLELHKALTTHFAQRIDKLMEDIYVKHGKPNP